MTKRQQIFDILDKQGYILDGQTVKIFGDESGIWKIGEYVRQWRVFKRDKDFFEGKKIIEKTKFMRNYGVRTDDMPERRYHRVSKQFYDSVTL